MERVVKQILKIRIGVPDYFVDSWTKGKIYYEGNYTTKPEMDRKIEEAKAQWEIDKKKRWGACAEKVKVFTWWEDVEVISESFEAGQIREMR